MRQATIIGIAIAGVVIIGIVVYFATSSSSSSSQPSGSGGGKGDSKSKSGFMLSDSDAVVFSDLAYKIPPPVDPAKGVTFVFNKEQPTLSLFSVSNGDIVYEAGIAFRTTDGRSLRSDVFAVGPSKKDGYMLYATLPVGGSVQGSLKAVSPSDQSETSTPIAPELFYGRLIGGDIVSAVSIETGTVLKQKQLIPLSNVRDYLKTRDLANDAALLSYFPNRTTKGGRVSAVNAYAWVSQISTDLVSEPYEGGNSDADVGESETNKSFTGRPGTLALSLAVKNTVTLTYTPHFTKELSKTPPYIAKVENYAPINGNTLQTMHGFWCDGQACWLLYTRHVPTSSTSDPVLFVHIVYIQAASNTASIYASTQKVEAAFLPREFRYSPSLQQPYLKTTHDECVLLYVNKAACSSTGSVWRKISTAAWNGVKSLVRSIPGALQTLSPYVVGMALGAVDTLSPEWGPYVTMGVNVIIAKLNPAFGAKVTIASYGTKYGLEAWNAIAKQAHQKVESIAPSTETSKPFAELKEDNTTALTGEKEKLQRMWTSFNETFKAYLQPRSNVSEAEKPVYASFDAEYARAKALYDDAISTPTFAKVSDAIVVLDTLRFKRDTYDAQRKAAKANTKPPPVIRPQIVDTVPAPMKSAAQAGSQKSTMSFVAREAKILLRIQKISDQLNTHKSTLSAQDFITFRTNILTILETSYIALLAAPVNEKEKRLQELETKLSTFENEVKGKTESYTVFPEVTTLEEQLVVTTNKLSLHNRRLESLHTRVRDHQSQLDTLQDNVVTLTPEIENAVSHSDITQTTSLYF